jgi:NAD(P)-dependent dehydrogenase (short-subunit alcohol dehydrogenase family)
MDRYIQLAIESERCINNYGVVLKNSRPWLENVFIRSKHHLLSQLSARVLLRFVLRFDILFAMDGNLSGDMKGKVVIVTGANAGLGKATAAQLSDLGATVVLACRSRERGEAALNELSCVEGRCFDLMPLDLVDLDSVRAFAAAFAEKYGRLDALINNAGILGRHRELTKQGFELSFGVNYLGAFLLTMLLLPLLEKSEQGRVIMMTSIAHGWGDVRFDDLNYTRGYNRFAAYGHSKLCNLLITRALAEKLRTCGSRVTINAVHPGIVATDIVVNRTNDRFRWVAMLMKILFMTSDEGAKTSVHLACDPALDHVSGEYFYRCKIEPSSVESKNLASANRLYDLSLKLCGLDDPLKS